MFRNLRPPAVACESSKDTLGQKYLNVAYYCDPN